VSAESASREKLPVRALLADAGRVYTHHWRILIPLAAVVLLPQALGDSISIEVDTDDLGLGRAAVAGVGVAGLTAITLTGEALYAGIITALVVEWRYGLPGSDLRARARALPYGRLIVADILLTIGAIVGLIALVVPGVLFVTYFLVTTVMIELEDLGVREGMRRSASLVRGSFWRVLAIAAMTMLGTELVTAAIEFPFHGFAFETAANLAAEVLVEPFQGVATVLVALGLMGLRGERPPDPRRRREPGPE
jgi:hypothetical protein